MTAVRPRAAIAVTAAIVLLVVAILGALHESRDPLPGPPERPPGLADLWAGRAAMVLERTLPSAVYGTPPASGAFSGAHVEIVDGTWYLFNRYVKDQPCVAAGQRLTGTQVRASSDRGATWGPPSPILTPTPGTAWSCAASDGDAVYDPARGTWSYLFQCMGDDGVWNGCLAERRDPSPLGAFAPASPLPVIHSGELWSQICDPGEACAAKPVGDEGTFNIFDRDPDGDWWVSFHGSDGLHGFRGVARSPDLRHWQVDGAGGTPGDAIIDATDALPWRETWNAGGPLGAGAGSTLRVGGWYYTLAEVFDTSPNCVHGQTWDLGLFRSRSPAAPQEQVPSGNPVVYSSRAPDVTGAAPACSVEYPGLFTDPDTGRTYVMYGRVPSAPGAADAIYLYRLEWNRNLLSDGGFTRLDAPGWQPATPGAGGIVVERQPDASPDGTQYATVSGGGVFADAAVPPGLAGGSVAFGGTLRSATGSGHVTVVLEQIDERSTPIARTAVDVGLTDRWTRVRRVVEVDARARRLRYVLRPGAGGAIRADNLFVIAQDGCDAPRYPAC